jgi:hypothetical protein
VAEEVSEEVGEEIGEVTRTVSRTVLEATGGFESLNLRFYPPPAPSRGG